MKSEIEHLTNEITRYMANRQFDEEELLFLSNLITLAKLEMQLEL